jgi:hypothetical protein
MRLVSSSNTALTCFLLSSVLPATESMMALFVYFVLIAVAFFAAMETILLIEFNCLGQAFTREPI